MKSNEKIYSIKDQINKTLGFSIVLSVVIYSAIIFSLEFKETQRENFDLVENNVRLIFNLSERLRLNGQFEYLKTKIVNLDLVEKVVILNDNCKVVSQAPLLIKNVPNCSGNDSYWSKINVDDNLTQIDTIFVKIQIKLKDLILKSLFKIFLHLLIFTGVILIFIKRNLNKYFEKPFDKLVNSILKTNRSSFELDNGNVPIEFKKVHQALIDKETELKKTHQEIINQEKVKLIKKVNSQVAHDINSPLVSLEMLTRDLEEVREDKRKMLKSSINQIKDMINNLKAQGVQKDADEPTLLTLAIDEISSEKRFQYKAIKELEINYSVSLKHLEQFSVVGHEKLKSIISNMINNSVEAGAFKIDLTLRESLDFNIIFIKDNGTGVDPSIIKNIFLPEISFGKENGKGLGLSLATDLVLSWDGKIKCFSKKGSGTLMAIKIPKARNPDWYLGELQLSKYKKICVIDDDISIHNLWDEKFKKFNEELDVSHVYEPFKLSVRSDTLYLIDFEFKGSCINGLDLIKANDFDKGQAVLVTSHFQEQEITDKVYELGIKVIPKPIVEFINIKRLQKLKRTYDFVYVEDELTLRLICEEEARKFNLNVLCLPSFREMDKHINEIEFSTPIFLDDDLAGEDIRGSDYSRKLKNLGFKKLFLSTCMEKTSFNSYHWIKGIVEKSFPTEDMLY